MEMKCASCGMPLVDGMPHCSMTNAHQGLVSMTCDGDTCTCPQCGNQIKVSEAKCDSCLGLTT